MSPFIEQLLAPNSTSDWLDRREAIDRETRKAYYLKQAQDWLAKHDPRYGGRA